MFMWKEIIMDEQLYLNSLQAVCVLQPHIKVNGDSSFLGFGLKRTISKICGIQELSIFHSLRVREEKKFSLSPFQILCL